MAHHSLEGYKQFALRILPKNRLLLSPLFPRLLGNYLARILPGFTCGSFSCLFQFFSIWRINWTYLLLVFMEFPFTASTVHLLSVYTIIFVAKRVWAIFMHLYRSWLIAIFSVSMGLPFRFLLKLFLLILYPAWKITKLPSKFPSAIRDPSVYR